jgi:hypothetical protein
MPQQSWITAENCLLRGEGLECMAGTLMVKSLACYYATIMSRIWSEQLTNQGNLKIRANTLHILHHIRLTSILLLWNRNRFLHYRSLFVTDYRTKL